jgi:DNA primase
MVPAVGFERGEMSSTFWQAEARFDWLGFVRDKGGIRALQANNEEYLLVCPGCGKPKLAVNVKKRAWQCWTCGEAGRDACSLIAKVERLAWSDALVSVLSGQRRPVGPINEVKAALEEDLPPPAALKAIPYPDGFFFLSDPQDVAAMRKATVYCQFRNIDPMIAQEMRLGICTRGLYRSRLIFPVFGSGGQLLFYQGRATWPPIPGRHYIKTLSPRKEEGTAGPAGCLLNLQWLIERGCPKRLLVVEGPIDCAHAWPDAVACFGKKLSTRQMELLVRAGVRELDLGFDADAMDTTLKQAPLLADLFELRVVHWPENKDPGDLTKDEIEICRQSAMPWGDGRLGELPAL